MPQIPQDLQDDIDVKVNAVVELPQIVYDRGHSDGAASVDPQAVRDQAMDEAKVLMKALVDDHDANTQTDQDFKDAVDLLVLPPLA